MYYRNFFYRAVALALVAALVTACGGGSSSTPTPTSTATPIPTGGNVLSVTVDAGPADSGTNVNRLYTAVKICQPGSTQCQTIDHVLVDTGSVGLRLLASVMTPGLNLGRVTGGSGLALLNCAQFVDNTFAWGPVMSADVVLAGKTAASVPIQVIADPAFGQADAACAAGGTAMTTATLLGANGILGLGLFRDDCGAECAVSPHNGSYFTCTDVGCSTTKGALASLDKQVKNPVPLFASDNNGFLIDLPAVGAAGASSLNGALIFGIGTQANNQLSSGAVLTTDSLGYFTSWLAGQSLGSSFFDSGSNGLFFDSVALANCSVRSGAGFYCPSSLLNLSATLIGANGARLPVAFSVDNATTLFADASKVVLPTLAGPIGDATVFDWGLPFFYGRRVFVGIEGQASSLGTGPFYAF